jgi:hypothetical protein
LLNYLDAEGQQICTPLAPGTDQPLAPLVDLKSGYVLRSVEIMPKQGAVTPWRLYQNYARDRLLFTRGSVRDRGVRFSRATAREPVAEQSA